MFAGYYGHTTIITTNFLQDRIYSDHMNTELDFKIYYSILRPEGVEYTNELLIRNTNVHIWIKDILAQEQM